MTIFTNLAIMISWWIRSNILISYNLSLHHLYIQLVYEYYAIDILATTTYYNRADVALKQFIMTHMLILLGR